MPLSPEQIADQRAKRRERWLVTEADERSRARIGGVFDVCGTPSARRIGPQNIALALCVRCRVRAYLDAFERFFGGHISGTVWTLTGREDTMLCAAALMPYVGQRTILGTWLQLRALVGGDGTQGGAIAMGQGERAERDLLLAAHGAQRRARRTTRARFAEL